jgi:hypothetical protein
MTLFEVNEASKMVQQEAHEDANIIFGAVIDEKLKDKLRVTVIATGFNKYERKSMEAPATTLPKYRNASSNVETAAHRTGRSTAATARAFPEEKDRTLDLSGSMELRQAAVQDKRRQQQIEFMESGPSPQISELKKLVAEIGVVDMGQDEYDIPTFLRKQAD